MSEFFREYGEARSHAQTKADRLGLDVAIRATKEYGRKGFSVHLASRNGSDYALAEIVRPAAGKEWKRNPLGSSRAPKKLYSGWVRYFWPGSVMGASSRSRYFDSLAAARKWAASEKRALEREGWMVTSGASDVTPRSNPKARGMKRNPAQSSRDRQSYHEAEERRYHALPTTSSCRDIAGGRDVEKSAAYAHGAAAKLWREVDRYAPSRSEKALRAEIRKAEKASASAAQADADYRACRAQIEALKARIAARAR